ncbi:MAG: SUMF1/EgtB/PvdO family nonheme iron enzyme [Deltaproteobacteria bacterium]|nr:SUMF1/EgtB/PvdO family nonheme iron enzyme [Deltaproteobacteria bacterium]
MAIAAALSGCTAPGDATVLASLPELENRLPLREPRATLDVLDAEGRAAAVELAEPVEGAPTLLQSPLPVPCTEAGQCSIGLRLAPGRYRFVLHVAAQDRCGTEGELLRFASGEVEVAAFGSSTAALQLERADFDGDGDGVPAFFELLTCGRFDVVDGAAPAACLDPADPCCKEGSPLEGRRTAFAGGSHTRADGSVAEIAPFALDATEATWRQLARCVAARACLVNQPEHPVRQVMASAPADEPVYGLTPAEAEQLCAFADARLPQDDEWDFAAAHRDAGTRGRYPWDGDDLGALVVRVGQGPSRAPAGDDDVVGCDAADPGVSANHQRRQAACPGAPLPVGSFPSSNVRRGAGVPLADLGGNVAEWTVVPGGSLTIPEVPDGAAAVVLRGGDATSPIELLENDIPVVSRQPANGDATAWSTTVRRLSAMAGVRCAVSVDDGTTAPPFVAEPSCGP